MSRGFILVYFNLKIKTYKKINSVILKLFPLIRAITVLYYSINFK